MSFYSLNGGEVMGLGDAGMVRRITVTLSAVAFISSLALLVVGTYWCRALCVGADGQVSVEPAEGDCCNIPKPFSDPETRISWRLASGSAGNGCGECVDVPAGKRGVGARSARRECHVLCPSDAYAERIACRMAVFNGKGELERVYSR